jgi:hypothetical protein
MRQTLLLLFCAFLFAASPPLLAQEERAHNATLLLRTASFGATMETAVTYQLAEYQPGRWIAHAQYAEPSTVNWMVIAAPMGGPNAGYVQFLNSENETMTIDVLLIDQCYGTTGEIRIGW